MKLYKKDMKLEEWRRYLNSSDKSLIFSDFNEPNPWVILGEELQKKGALTEDEVRELAKAGIKEEFPRYGAPSRLHHEDEPGEYKPGDYKHLTPEEVLKD